MIKKIPFYEKWDFLVGINNTQRENTNLFFENKLKLVNNLKYLLWSRPAKLNYNFRDEIIDLQIINEKTISKIAKELLVLWKNKSIKYSKKNRSLEFAILEAWIICLNIDAVENSLDKIKNYNPESEEELKVIYDLYISYQERYTLFCEILKKDFDI